jgi:tetratricopeptide (TPR) repeat protein
MKSYSKVGNSFKEQSQYDRALNNYEKGLALSQKLSSEAPDYADWQVAAFFQLICKTQFLTHHPKTALMRARDATAFFRNEAERLPDQRDRLAQTLNNQAWYALLAGYYDEALSSVTEAIALAPERLELRVNKIHALALTADYDIAKAFYSNTRSLYGADGSILDKSIETDLGDFRDVGMSASNLEKIKILMSSSNKAAEDENR